MKFRLLHWLVLIALACLSVLLYGFGRGIPYSEQWVLYEALRNTASIIFGVMGAWLAIVYPEALENVIKGKTKSGSEVYSKLLEPLIYSTIILILVLVIGIISPIAKQINFFASHASVLRGISFSILSILTILQIWSLILTLLPADMTQREISERSSIGTAISRWTSRNQKPGKSEEENN